MSMPLVPPLAITGAYQNSQMADGTYVQGGSQVFSHLVNPPVSGQAAEIASDVKAKNTGYVAGTSTSEVQTVTVNGTPTGGSFPLSFRGQPATIPFNATNTQVQTALQGLSTIGSGNATVAGGPLPGAAVTVTYAGTLAGQDVPALVPGTTAGLTGGTNVSVQVVSTTPGVKRDPTGITAATNPAIQNSYQNRDAMRDFYDTASGN